MLKNSAEYIKYGYVISYYPERGFGFICDNDEEDEYFFHISNLEYPFEIIPEKTRVSFKVVEKPKGICAVNIKQYFPHIEGEFGFIPLPNSTVQLTNEECYKYLKKQQKEILQISNILSKYGISAQSSSNGWVSLNTDLLNEIDDPSPKNGHRKKEVLSSYPDTIEHILRLLQKQINSFNRAYNIAVKGFEGEEKTKQSLMAVSVNYPVLNNILLEETNGEIRYSAETDTLIITDKAIFLIETKNFGGKGDTITISSDGLWEITNTKKKEKFALATNPYKQITDHIFVIRKFFEKNNIKNLPIIPIIAIANNDVHLDISDDIGLAKILRVELIGTYVLNYIESNNSTISKKTISKINEIIQKEKLPPKKYSVLNYCENIQTICCSLMKLLQYYNEDYEEVLRKKNEAKEKARIKREEKKRQDQTKQEKLEKQEKQELSKSQEEKDDSGSVLWELAKFGAKILYHWGTGM